MSIPEYVRLMSCRCQNCLTQTISFEVDRAGESVACPGCGLDTTLYTTKHIQVKVWGKDVVFPSACPHCLQPATAIIGIQSPEETTGYYVLFSRWKHSTIRVPFCLKFAQRLYRAETVGLTAFFITVAVYIVLIIALGILDFNGWWFWPFALSLFAVRWMPHLFVRHPGKYIQLLAVNEDSVEFSVPNGDYARMLERSNHKKKPTRDKDNGQSFSV